MAAENGHDVNSGRRGSYPKGYNKEGALRQVQRKSKGKSGGKYRTLAQRRRDPTTPCQRRCDHVYDVDVVSTTRRAAMELLRPCSEFQTSVLRIR